MTIEVSMMDEREARRITERIRIAAHNYTEARTKLMERVQEAKDGKAHVALGYASWTAYLAEVLGEEPMRLARDERQDMVRMLANEGMSRPAIAAVTGVNERTVQRDFKDIRQGETHVSPWETSPPPEPATASTMNTVEPDVIDAEPVFSPAQPPKITGMDGKQYSRPEPVEPPKPKRRPITDQARDAGWEIRKATEKLQRIFNDDRLNRNKEEVATHLRGHLEYAIETLQGFIDTINDK